MGDRGRAERQADLARRRILALGRDLERDAPALARTMTRTVRREMNAVGVRALLGDGGPRFAEGVRGKIAPALRRAIGFYLRRGFRDGQVQPPQTLTFSDDYLRVVPREAVEWLDGYVPELAGVWSESLLVRVREVIKRHLVVGGTTEMVSSALAAVLSEAGRVVAARAEAVARTESMRAYNMGSLVGMRETEGFVRGVRFSAILDKRTSRMCRMRDGMTFRLDDPRLMGNTPPLHPNCRSVLVPVTAFDRVDWSTVSEVARLPETRQRPEDLAVTRLALGF